MLKRAATVIQFAVRSYYHWVMEALGRLLLLGPRLAADPTLQIILPKDGKGDGFIAQFLALLPVPLAPTRILWYNTRDGPNSERVRVGELLYPDWDPVRHTDSDEPVHCLAPRSVLRMIRESFSAPNPPSTGNKSRPLLVFVTRRGQTMRRLVNEEALLEALRQDAGPDFYEIALFDGDSSSVRETIALFSRATVVVGVHGGALANIVFCGEGATVVELGLRSPATRHYAHAAMALGLQYGLHLVDRTAQGVASGIVSVGPATIRTIVAAVRQAMAEQLQYQGEAAMDFPSHPTPVTAHAEL